MYSLNTIIPNKKKALFFAKRELPVMVCDAVNLEGINYTLPEIQTLLDGVTVGGHKLSDEQITLNQAKAWNYLFAAVEANQFSLTKEFSCQLHAIAAKEESLEWGCFRSGAVTIAGTDYTPPGANKLDELWSEMLMQAKKITDIFDKAIFIFLQMARYQFFYDVNKRMGRFMMNGILLDHGLPAINLPAKRQLEFNKLMLDFYPSGDISPMTAFMKSCIDPRIIKIMSENSG
ncbi:MAG: Fic family protein [Gammaproteobacteria bacterium]